MKNNRWAVFDVETTGFGKSDHVLEIAVVLVDDTEVVGSWETLINPQRDISNSSIHGISASELSLAPIFGEISNDLGKIFHDRIMVAHNLSFDQRMLEQEFDRVNMDYHFGQGLCTYQVTKQKLTRACAFYGIQNPRGHSALSDAMATAILLSKLELPRIELIPGQFDYDPSVVSGRTLSRSAYKHPDEKSSNRIRLILRSTDIAPQNSKVMSYLDALISALSDLDIDKLERNSLKDWANYLGLSASEVRNAHEQYLDELIKSALRDSVISNEEFATIEKIANLLEVSVPETIHPSKAQEVRLFIGSRVCFTGTAFNSSGEEITRDQLQKIAMEYGLVPVNSVSKKGCDLLVAANLSTMSSKAMRAREIGIPVISTLKFLDLVGR